MLASHLKKKKEALSLKSIKFQLFRENPLLPVLVLTPEGTPLYLSHSLFSLFFIHFPSFFIPLPCLFSPTFSFCSPLSFPLPSFLPPSLFFLPLPVPLIPSFSLCPSPPSLPPSSLSHSLQVSLYPSTPSNSIRPYSTTPTSNAANWSQEGTTFVRVFSVLRPRLLRQRSRLWLALPLLTTIPTS